MSLLHEILRDIALPAVGCTEPAAIALAAATAREAVGGTIERLSVVVDPGTFKNAMFVTVPNAGGKTGIAVAAALGGLYGRPELKLEVLRDVPVQASEIVEQIISQGRVEVGIGTEEMPVYIEAAVKTSAGSGRAVIKGRHVDVVLVEANGEEQLNRLIAPEPRSKVGTGLPGMKVNDIYRLAAALEPDSMRFLLDSADMNMAIAREGLAKRSGAALGANIRDMANEGLISGGLVNEVRAFTAAAVDARMAGSGLPVMTISGSGNQGIATTVPVVIVARNKGYSDLQLAGALALGYLLSAYARARIGELSTLCGTVVASAIGAAAGIIKLFDGKEEEIEKAVNAIVSSVIGSVAGVLCCGANEACALKVATGSGIAVETAFLAMQNIAAPARNGIVGDSVESSLGNLRLVGQSLGDTERTILNIMKSGPNQSAERCPSG